LIEGRNAKQAAVSKKGKGSHTSIARKEGKHRTRFTSAISTGKKGTAMEGGETSRLSEEGLTVKGKKVFAPG